MLNRRNLLLGAIAVASVGGVFVNSRAKQMAREAEAAYPPLGKIISVLGVDVHFRRQGAGRPVILLHGAGGNLRDFTMGLADRIAQTNEVISFDRPGHGYTDLGNVHGKSPYSQATLLYLAARQIGISKATIAGYSLGGTVALAWALEYPEFAQSLLLIAAPSNPWPVELRLLYRATANPVSGAIVAPSIAAFSPPSLTSDVLTSVFQPQNLPVGYEESLGVALSMRENSLRANTRQIIALRRQVIKMSQRYGELSLPVELIHGTEDEVVNPDIHSKKMAELLAQAKYTSLSGIGHGAQIFGEDAIFEALERLNTLHAGT